MKSVKVIAIILILPMSASLVSGCKGDSPQYDAMQLLNEATEAVSAAGGYRLKGDIEMGMGEGSAPVAMAITAEIQNAPDGMRQHMYVEMGGFEAEAYMVGDTYYQYAPGQGWRKMSLGLYKAQNMNMGLVDADQMELMAKMAADSRVLEENDGRVGVSFHLGKEYFDASMTMYREYVEESGGEVSEDWLRMVEESITDFSADISVWIDTSSRLIERMEISYSMAGIPQVGEVTSSMRMDLYDYGQDIVVELPAEAAQAEELQQSP